MEKVVGENKTLYYLASDHLSSSSVVMNSSGGLESENRYMPFGEVRDITGTDDPITETDFGYTGQRNISGIGLMDYNARFYNPTLGRFLQSDTLGVSMENPQSLNRFSYVKNRPILFNDPSGHRMCSWDGDGCDEEEWEDTDPIEEAEAEAESGGGDPAKRDRKDHGCSFTDLYESNASEDLLLSNWTNPLGNHYEDQMINFGQKRKPRPDDDLHCPGCREYHMSIDNFGDGIDSSEPVYSGAPGKVVFVNVDTAWDLGAFVIIEHVFIGDYYYSIYGHLDETEMMVNVGNPVAGGQGIGVMGSTGTGMEHLHFEIRKAANIDLSRTNPLKHQRYWGFKQDEWREYFVDLGKLYGYDADFCGMP